MADNLLESVESVLYDTLETCWHLRNHIAEAMIVRNARDLLTLSKATPLLTPLCQLAKLLALADKCLISVLNIL